MSARRNDFEIMAEILQIAKSGANRTKIVYRANINFKLLKYYLVELEKADLIKVDGGIKTTEKGKGFLNCYRDLMNFVSAKPVIMA